MKVKTVALLVVAIGCGLFAMLGVRQAMNGNAAANQEEKVPVLMAVTEIPVGTPLTPENVMFKDVAVSLVPEGAILTEEEYNERAASITISPDDFITMAKLTEPGVKGESVQIPKGWRVVSVRVNDTQTHSNMLAPGDRVDVLVTYQSRTQRGMTTKTKPLLEYVTIFATGNKTENSGGKDGDSQVKNVSLLVTPEQASFVYLAERKGELSLVWRHPADDEQVQVGSIDERLMEELSGTADRNAQYAFGGYGNPLEDGPSQQPQVSNFLSEQATPEPEVKEEPQVEIAQVDPDKPMWKMQIFIGDELEEVQLELPEEEIPEDAGSTGDTGEATEAVSTPVENPFGSVIEQFKNLPFGSEQN